MRIAVVKHAGHTEPLNRRYVIGALCDVWKEHGFEVLEVHGTKRFVPADLAIAHVELTVTPPEYAEFLSQYPVAVNASMNDISKRRISPLLLRQVDPWDGRVIAKTNLNCRGVGEKLLLGKTHERDPWRFVPLRLSRHLRNRFNRWSRLPEYRIFKSIDRVPPEWWEDESIVLEKLVSEREGDAYVLRRTHFFGDRWINRAMRSLDPIARGGTTFDARPVEPPDEVFSIRDSLSLEFGRIDYAMVDGRVILYDVNKTPSMNMASSVLLALMRDLAGGIDFYRKR